METNENASVTQQEFIEFQREDGTIEFRHPNYDQLMAEADALPPNEAPTISAEDIAKGDLLTVRRTRNQKLAETDWWANSDITMSQEQIDYRQALRDITKTYVSMTDVVWPTKPEY